MKHSNFLFPAFVVCTALVWLAYAAMPPTDPVDGFHLNKFAMIPVQENGRLMPFDTFARTKLMMLNHRQDAVQVVLSGEENALLLKKAVGKITAEEEAALEQFETARNTAIKNGDKVKVRTVPAHEWALNTMMLRSIKINPVDEMYIFRIDNDQLLAFLDLKPSRQFGLYYKLSDFDSNNRFWERFREIHNNKGVRKGDILDAKIADLANKIDVIMRLAQFDVPFLVPPKMPAGNDQDIAEEKWLTLSAAAAQLDQGNVDPAFLQISQTLRAFMKGDKAAFNTALDRYLNMVNDKYPGVASKMQTEYRFNHFAPYVQCITLFICVLIMAILSWVVWHQPLRYAAWSLGILTMILYTWTLVVRVQISGYAPVTNLYSSAVFIGWGCAGLCLLLELILRNGIGSAIAAVMGTIALNIAHNLLDGDSMGKLVAVLERNRIDVLLNPRGDIQRFRPLPQRLQ